ncbi:hypothetical protein AN641_03070 [Candidatus Epulonipiscioides gigas]|nr:hypothetical protein AN641_03070 [Epulopiscium sp. SCG-C07WGA-EpuloA2]
MVGFGAALMAVFSQLAIPIPNVPLTLQIFGVVLLGVILPRNISTLSLIVYTLLGAVGVPVFANFSGGISKLVGATGGYLYSFIFAVFIIGTFAKNHNTIKTLIGAYLGVALSYILGTIQLKFYLDMTWTAAIIAGTGSGIFLIKDIILVAVAVIIGERIRIILNKHYNTTF